ncbi:hypothetical protein DFH07DRAFT_971918 [Mycena maculata]|uniref:Uncharacterized protein n=1 Tax=Mycena maculata TaxID=230809 RepID=A0AAD7HL72_9AGAR|nr:hypothetical protein DFH07DRAFT_971918 [Mycena maculata]
MAIEDDHPIRALIIHLLRTEVNQERHEISVRHHMRQLGQKKMLHAVGHRALMRARQAIEHINIKLRDALQRYDEAMDLLSAVWDRALREGIATVLVEERVLLRVLWARHQPRLV